MNQIEKQFVKFKKEIYKLVNKSIKEKKYTFKYVDKNNSEGLIGVFDRVIDDLNTEFEPLGYTISYIVEEKRSETTHFWNRTVYTVSITTISKTDAMIAKSRKAKAANGDNIEW